MKQIRSLIIPAAGIGSRLHPLTHITPKEMLRLVDKPIFYYLVQEAYLAGIKHIIFIIHAERTDTKIFIQSEKANTIHEDFPGISFSFIETKERFGDGHAILQAKKLIKKDEVFAVTMGDLISIPGTSLLQELKTQYEKRDSAVISIEAIDKKKTEQYGVISPSEHFGRLHRVASIVEKPKPKDAPSNLAMTGKYILNYEIFAYIERLVKARTTGEVKLANALSDYAHEHKLYAYECRHKHYDTGTKIDLLKTEIIFALTHPEYGQRIRKYVRDLKKL